MLVTGSVNWCRVYEYRFERLSGLDANVNEIDYAEDSIQLKYIQM